MNQPLPPVVAQLLDASKTRSVEAYLATFHENAVVVDEGTTYSGISAIRQWRISINSQFEYTMDIEQAATQEGEFVVKALLTGTFPGSPVHLFYHFELRDGKIAHLVIADQ
jgi:hypothetical protein